MATHSSILAWRISRTEEPGGLHSSPLHSGVIKESDTTEQHTHMRAYTHTHTHMEIEEWRSAKQITQYD